MKQKLMLNELINELHIEDVLISGCRLNLPWS